MQEGKLQEVKDGLFVDMYDALLFDGKNEIKVDGVDSAVTYFSQISKPKRKMILKNPTLIGSKKFLNWNLVLLLKNAIIYAMIFLAVFIKIE